MHLVGSLTENHHSPLVPEPVVQTHEEVPEIGCVGGVYDVVEDPRKWSIAHLTIGGDQTHHGETFLSRWWQSDSETLIVLRSPQLINPNPQIEAGLIIVEQHPALMQPCAQPGYEVTLQTHLIPLPPRCVERIAGF